MSAVVEQTPAGYKRDGQGRLVPVESIKPIDMARDELVQEIVFKAKCLSVDIADFRAEAFADISAFVQLSAEQYGAKVGGTKGNVTLLSFDGRYKVQRAIQERIVFDERLQAAKALIDACIHKWSQGARSEIRTLINSAFEVDKEGNINTGRVLGLRRLDITDAEWQLAMKAIGDAVQVAGSKSYLRVYERIGDTDEYKPISLDVASA
ncbi:MAG: DUF3164 family protein [Rhodocyclaceae bacterium]|nr:DUF3164 family protein [Rhodocyclaceae bacterium]